MHNQGSDDNSDDSLIERDDSTGGETYLPQLLNRYDNFTDRLGAIVCCPFKALARLLVFLWESFVCAGDILKGYVRRKILGRILWDAFPMLLTLVMCYAGRTYLAIKTAQEFPEQFVGMEIAGPLRNLMSGAFAGFAKGISYSMYSASDEKGYRFVRKKAWMGTITLAVIAGFFALITHIAGRLMLNYAPVGSISYYAGVYLVPYSVAVFFNGLVYAFREIACGIRERWYNTLMGAYRSVLEVLGIMYVTGTWPFTKKQMFEETHPMPALGIEGMAVAEVIQFILGAGSYLAILWTLPPFIYYKFFNNPFNKYVALPDANRTPVYQETVEEKEDASYNSNTSQSPQEKSCISTWVAMLWKGFWQALQISNRNILITVLGIVVWYKCEQIGEEHSLPRAKAFVKAWNIMLQVVNLFMTVYFGWGNAIGADIKDLLKRMREYEKDKKKGDKKTESNNQQAIERFAKEYLAWKYGKNTKDHQDFLQAKYRELFQGQDANEIEIALRNFIVEDIKDIVFCGQIVTSIPPVIATIWSLVSVIYRPAWLGLFFLSPKDTQKNQVINALKLVMPVGVLGFWMLSWQETSTGILRGFGYDVFPMVTDMIGAVVGYAWVGAAWLIASATVTTPIGMLWTVVNIASVCQVLTPTISAMLNFIKIYCVQKNLTVDNVSKKPERWVRDVKQWCGSKLGFFKGNLPGHERRGYQDLGHDMRVLET